VVEHIPIQTVAQSPVPLQINVQTSPHISPSVSREHDPTLGKVVPAAQLSLEHANGVQVRVRVPLSSHESENPPHAPKPVQLSAAQEMPSRLLREQVSLSVKLVLTQAALLQA